MINETTQFGTEGTDVLSDAVFALLQDVINVIDDRMENRLKSEDFLKAVTGKIMSMKTKDINMEIKDNNSTVIGYATKTVPTSITVRYNDEQTVTIANDSVKQLSADDNGQYIKIGTYNNSEYYVLHKM